ncbi:DMT family transporter [Vagococcus sp.]|uniref:DMT family transporter n=1 Tax=Vagococcus sp. TaxID=1933889 RepID=UPI003F9DE1D0
MKNSKYMGFFYAIVGCIFWGGSGTAAQYFFEHNQISTQWVVGVRLLTAGLLLLLWCFFTIPKQVKHMFTTPKHLLKLIAFGFLGVLPSQFTYFMAIRLGNAPTATVLQFLSPLFILIYLAIRYLKLPRKIDFISIAIAMLGTFLLVTKGNIYQLSLSPAAIIWGILAGVSGASNTLLPQKLLKEFDAKLVTGGAMFVSGLAFLPLLVKTEIPTFNTPSLLTFIYIIIFGTMLSYLFYISSLNYISPSLTSMLSAFEPLTATLLSIILLSTPFSLIEIIGSALILSVTFLQAFAAQVDTKRRKVIKKNN